MVIPVDNVKINNFILHLRKGSGRRFLITLVPDGTELLGQGVLSNINYPGVKKDIGLEIECYNAARSGTAGVFNICKMPSRT